MFCHAKENNIRMEGLGVKENVNKPALKTETDIQCSNSWLHRFKLPQKTHSTSCVFSSFKHMAQKCDIN